MGSMRRNQVTLGLLVVAVAAVVGVGCWYRGYLAGFLPSGAADADEGELWIRGPSLFQGYHEDAEASAEALRDGWYRTGDLVRRTADGSISILGRLSSDVMKVKGHRVSALEIEAALAEHPGVAEVAVVGAPRVTAGGGEPGDLAPVAFVRARDPALTADALRSHAQRLLAPYQVPSRIELVEDLPRVGPGKIDRASLRARCGG